MSDDLEDDFVIRFADTGRREPEDDEEREGMYAEGRRTDRTYVSKTFNRFGIPGNRARYVWKVFDPEGDTELEPYGDGEVWLVKQSEKGRVQVKLLVAREQGHVSELWIERIAYPRGVARAKNTLRLRGPDVERLIELIRNLAYIPMEGEDGVRVDDALLHKVFTDPASVARLYERNPTFFAQMISGDVEARDVVALKRRRAEVARFKRLLDDDEYFDEQVPLTPHKRPEDVWQGFFEENPWILGVGLGGQLLTSWSRDRLEQVVAGTSIAREGKRVDALMRTSGIVSWLTFAEFKHHRTNLLHGTEYRPGAWRVDKEVAGGVAQAQDTIHRATQDIGEYLRSRAGDGSEVPHDVTFLTRPRSYLVVGQLGQLLGEEGGPHPEKIRSFESFRRSLSGPEIVTFDELLARAEWVVDLAEG
jgi:Domain of unknown function (DUF4263)